MEPSREKERRKEGKSAFVAEITACVRAPYEDDASLVLFHVPRDTENARAVRVVEIKENREMTRDPGGHV